MRLQANRPKLLLVLLGDLHQSPVLGPLIATASRNHCVVARVRRTAQGVKGWIPDKTAGLLVRGKQRLPRGYRARLDNGAYAVLVLGVDTDDFSARDEARITTDNEHRVQDTPDHLAQLVRRIIDALSNESSNALENEDAAPEEDEQPQELPEPSEPLPPVSPALSGSGSDEDDEHDVSLFRPQPWQNKQDGPRRSTIFLRNRHRISPANGERAQSSPFGLEAPSCADGSVDAVVSPQLAGSSEPDSSDGGEDANTGSGTQGTPLRPAEKDFGDPDRVTTDDDPIDEDDLDQLLADQINAEAVSQDEDTGSGDDGSEDESKPAGNAEKVTFGYGGKAAEQKSAIYKAARKRGVTKFVIVRGKGWPCRGGYFTSKDAKKFTNSSDGYSRRLMREISSKLHSQ